MEREKEQMMREKEELMLRLQDYEEKTKKAEKGGFVPSGCVRRGAFHSKGQMDRQLAHRQELRRLKQDPQQRLVAERTR